MWKNYVLGVLVLGWFGCCPTAVRAQKEAAIWYFGDTAGLDFRSGNPRALTDGQINTIEGCESYSDAQGNLLFYTDGKTVWNRNHQVMPNGTGLKGSFSTSQAALVVPYPGRPDSYFVFTPDDALAYNGVVPGGSNGFNYSVIDMRQDGGLGDVTGKNITLLQNASENVTAVRDFNAGAYWILTHHRDRFYAYRLDADGLDPEPVVSLVGPSITGFENVRGNIKIAPDGTRVGITHNELEPGYGSHLYVYDFSVETGRVTRPLRLGPGRLYYGVEFSPDSSKLYASGKPIVPGAEGEEVLGPIEIVQFDLRAAEVPASEYTLHQFEENPPGWVAGALQLGIDRKIYHSIPANALSVIRSPDNPGIRSDFRPFAVPLAGRRSTYGLPPFIQSFFETIVTIEQLCLGEPTRFTLTTDQDIRAVHWDFGDPDSGAANTSQDLSPKHLFTDFGTYEVHLLVTYQDGSVREFLEFVEIAQVPDLLPEVTLTQCDLDGLDDGQTTFNLRESIELFAGGNTDINAYFFETEADAEAQVNFLEDRAYRNLREGQVVYARAFENPDCPSIIAVTLQTRAVERPLAVEQVPICLDRPPSLAVEVNTEQLFTFLDQRYPGVESAVYRSESDALLERSPLLSSPLYLGPMDGNQLWFRLEQEGGCDAIGILELDYRAPVDTGPGPEVVLCRGSALLQAPPGFQDYIWEDGSQGETFQVTEPGTYTLVYSDQGCPRSFTYSVRAAESFRLDGVAVQDFSTDNRVEVRIAGKREGVRFSLDGGLSFQESPLFRGLDPGVYELVVRDTCTVYEQTVLVGGLPDFFTPNGDGRNDRWQLWNPGFYGTYLLEVFDRYGNLVSRLSEGSPGWDGTRGGQPLPASDYWYRLTLQEGRVIQGHVALLR